MRILLAVLMMAGVLAPASAGSWPDGQKAAVVLTYDDALQSQFENVLPQLDAAGLKGTFFLPGKGIRPEDVARWRAVAAEGHELGNHTLFHPCARGRYAMPVQYNTESYSIQTMLSEIKLMNAMLTAIDGKTKHAFTVPCGDTKTGDGDYVEPLHESGIVGYMRDLYWPKGDDRGGIDLNKAQSVWFPETATGAEMIDAVKRAEASGGLLVFGFHGVGGDYLKVSAEAHRELVDYLKTHRSTVWVGTFSTVIDYVMAQKAK